MKIINKILFIIIYLFIACASSYSNEHVRKQIAILEDVTAGTDTVTVKSVADALRREKFEIVFLSSEDVCDTSKLSSQKYFLYVIPNPIAYPKDGGDALANYIKGKGNLLILGAPVLPGNLLIETISPNYKMYPMHDIASLTVSENQGVFSSENIKLPVPKTALSCFRRPMGKGFERGYSYRWIPLITAHDKDGLELGSASWILINEAPLNQDEIFKDALQRLVATTKGNQAKEQMNLEGSVFAVCAITDSVVLQKLAKTPLFGNIAKRIAEGAFLSHAGALEFSYWPSEKMQFGASVVNYGFQKKQVNAIIRVISKATKKVVFEKNENFEINPGEKLKKAFGEIPAISESEGYQVTTKLMLRGEKIDEISYEIGLLSTNEEPREAFVTTKGRDFWLEGKKWCPVGTNYWPRSAIATEQVDYLYHWLTPGYYDPEQVDDDLHRLKDMGANFVAIRANYTENKRTLLDFLRRCRNHGIRVFVFLQTHEVTVEPHYFQGIMMPFHFEEDKVTEFIKDTRISTNPALLGWDLIWEPSGWAFNGNVSMFGWDGNSNFRNQWNKDWINWINERYGSISNAEADWDMPVSRGEDGLVTSPSDEQFKDDGKWRIMVAAYRRFMDDLMNRKWNDACSKLRKLDPNHLISYRQGNLPPFDFTLTSTLKHVDFFSMEGYDFRPDNNGSNTAGFINRYLSYALENKPFIWLEYGYGGPWGKYTHHMDGEDIFTQSNCVELINNEAYKNGANGIAPWWFAGGLRASEKTDFGITTPEGTLRPSGESLKKYGEMYKNSPPSRPIPDEWFLLDSDKNSGGLWYITHNDGAKAYEKASAERKTLGLRTLGTGTTSADTPLLAVGNTAYNGKNPPKYLNSEFNWFKIKIGDDPWIEVSDGMIIKVPKKKLVLAKASLGNLQDATWLKPASCQGKPGAVYLASTDVSGVKVKVSIPKDTERFQDADFGDGFLLTKGISSMTKIELQMTAEGRAWFGEKLRFTLVPSDY